MFDIQSILIYFGLAIFSYQSAKYATRWNDKKAVWLIIILFSLISGLRSISVGIDTETYNNIFDIVLSGKASDIYSIEKGFEFVSAFLLRLWENNYFLFGIYAFFAHGLIIFCLWKNKQYISFQWAVFAYYVVFFTFSLNGLRQFIAASIVIWATNLIREGKYAKFIILVIIASSFHKTALVGLVYLLFELFLANKFNRNRKFKILIIVILALTFGYSILNDLLFRYSMYLESYSNSMGLMIPVKLLLLIFSIIIIGNPINDEIKKYVINSYRIYYLVSLFLSSLSYFFMYLGRIGLYFYVFEAFYIGSVFKTKNKNMWIVFIKIGYLLIMLYYLYGFLSNGQGEMPYRFFWQK